MILIGLYSIPFLVLLLFMRKELAQFLSVLKLPEAERNKRIEEYFWGKSRQEPSEAPQSPSTSLASIGTVVSLLGLVLVGPVFVARFALFLKYGKKLQDKGPFDVYVVWFGAFLLAAYYYTDNGQFWLSAAISATVLIVVTSFTVGDFQKQGNTLRIYRYPKHKIRVSSSLQHAMVVLVSFSSLYYCVSAYDSSSFSKAMSAYDSVVYSMNALIRNPFLTIRPVSKLADILTLVELVMTFLYVLVVLSVTIRVWSEKDDKTSNQAL